MLWACVLGLHYRLALWACVVGSRLLLLPRVFLVFVRRPQNWVQSRFLTNFEICWQMVSIIDSNFRVSRNLEANFFDLSNS